MLLHSIWARENGNCNHKAFFKSVACNNNVIRRYALDKRLHAHDGCVNTVNYNLLGTLLLSGSDDTCVHMYDVQSRRLLCRYPTVHNANIFCAKFMPNSQDTVAITCSLDGIIGTLDIEREVSSVLRRNLHSVKKLATIPGDANTFLSCDENGVVLWCDLRERNCRPLLACDFGLTSIDVCRTNPHMFVIGGDSEECRIIDVRLSEEPLVSFRPPADTRRQREHHFYGYEHITGVCFNYSNGGEVLASYHRREICLFDVQSNSVVHTYSGHENIDTVKSVNFFTPNCSIVMSGSDDGCVYMWDKNTEEIVNVIDNADSSVVNCIVGHPSEPLLVCSGIDSDAKLYAPVAVEPAVVSDVLSNVNAAPHRRIGLGRIALDDQLLMRLSAVFGLPLEFFGYDDDDDDDDDADDDNFVED